MLPKPEFEHQKRPQLVGVVAFSGDMFIDEEADSFGAEEAAMGEGAAAGAGVEAMAAGGGGLDSEANSMGRFLACWAALASAMEWSFSDWIFSSPRRAA